jgi:pimeloyl-ACP methyl ester carboxylesterase
VPQPHLTRADVADPRGLVLMLHGGKDRSHAPVDGRSLSWRRSRAMQEAILDRAHEAGVSVWLLRYRHRGWNQADLRSGSPSPVPDARWALEQVRRELGLLPTVLLGHSMGARTAVRVADDDLVSGVVAVAPWFPRDEPVRALRGRHLAAAHGRSDRITSFRATAGFVRRAREVATSAEMQDMGRVGHYMLRHVDDWNDFAISRSLRMLAIDRSTQDV